MKKLIFLLLVLTILGYAQCLSAPISTRFGLKLGITRGTYDPDDNLDKMTGTGTHFGFGMGTDFLNLLSLDMHALFRTTNYSRTEPLGRRTFSYNNLYFPIMLSIKAGMLPLVSPYLGVGLGMNVQFEGTQKWEPDGVAIETPIGGTNTNAFLILGLGVEIKLTKFRIIPEFTANINSGADDTATPNRTESNTDYHLSVGFYYGS
jgi:hypothetical protein